jgi:glutamate--cysteine ligase
MKFGDFLVHGCRSAQPVFGDWADHLTTLFTDARLKQHIELRSADAGALEHTLALQALWKGLLYDEAALEGAWELVKGWSDEDRERLRADVPRLALAASVAGRPVRDVARDALALARAGLRRRAMRDGAGGDESRYLDPLDAIAATGRTPAEELLDKYRGEWGGSVEPSFRESVF